MYVYIGRTLGAASVGRSLTRKPKNVDAAVQKGALCLFLTGVTISSFSLRQLALQAPGRV